MVSDSIHLGYLKRHAGLLRSGSRRPRRPNATQLAFRAAQGDARVRLLAASGAVLKLSCA